MSSGTPSARLTQELTKKIRDRGLVLWVDSDSQYSTLVDRLAQPGSGFEHPVVGFRGSFLELMLALEPYGNGLYPEKVLVHLAGLNKETVKETPVYELYKAGRVFEKGLATLVREAAVGVATPEEVEEFVRRPGLSLSAADEWIESLRAQPRDQLTLLLESIGRDNVVIELISGSARFKEELKSAEAAERLFTFLSREIGITSEFREYCTGSSPLQAHTLGELVASWLMAVEYVHDLREPPVTPALRALLNIGPIAADCRTLVARFRQHYPDLYETSAADFQERLAEERQAHGALALGSIDTFRFEEVLTRKAAIESLTRGDWATAQVFAKERSPEQCFWVRRSPELARTWELLRRTAELGLVLGATQQALKGASSLEEVVERYVSTLAPVDRQHRELEQRYHALVASDFEDYDALLLIRDTVRVAYRAWVDAINRRFFEVCKACGVLPDRALRQRAIYDDVVHPLFTRGGKVAYFMVDALRFEMAQALAQELKRDRFSVSVEARLAELPTITAVGMNALAPAQHQGRLAIGLKEGKISHLFSGEFKIGQPEDRRKAITRRVGAEIESLDLDEFRELTLAKLKKRLQTKPDLILVRSLELDTAGENRLHLSTFENTLSLLKSAILLLQQAGVERFVVTSDHGFLLQDSSVEVVPFGKDTRVPDRRHVLWPTPSGASDVLEVTLSSLEYDVEQDQYLVFRPDTAFFDTPAKLLPFVHGGNSLQERVIPVLVIERHGARGKTMARYEVTARAVPARLGRQRLKLAVRLQRQATGEISFAAPKTITLALRVVDRKDLSITLLNAEPPAKLLNGQLLLSPEKEEALVEFEILGGEVDEKVRVQVYHPDGVEIVKEEVVEGFFDVARDRRLGKPKPGSVPPVSPEKRPEAPAAGTGAGGWASQVEDEAYRRALLILEKSRAITEAELAQVLGSPRRVRAFSLAFDNLVRLLPFDVEIRTVQGMKAYVRKD
jgi:hypothetical protein